MTVENLEVHIQKSENLLLSLAQHKNQLTWKWECQWAPPLDGQPMPSERGRTSLPQVWTPF